MREHLLGLAAADPRVVAGAAVGGTVSGASDRWSDLDLAFGVADDSSLAEVLEDWTRRVVGELDAVQLFDFPHGSAMYRVPAPGLPAGRPLVRACIRLRRDRTPLRAAVRQRGREGSRPDPVSRRDLRPCRPSRRSRPLLDRARPTLAGGALDQCNTRSRARARVSATWAGRELRPGARQAPDRRPGRVRRHSSCVLSTAKSCCGRSLAQSSSC